MLILKDSLIISQVIQSEFEFKCFEFFQLLLHKPAVCLGLHLSLLHLAPKLLVFLHLAHRIRYIII